jgi:hypothetical protein
MFDIVTQKCIELRKRICHKVKMEIINDIIYLTREEVAEILQVKPRTLVAWGNRGVSLPFRRMGGKRVFYKLYDVERFYVEWDEKGYVNYREFRREKFFKHLTIYRTAYDK